jgi:ABC-2 type transport system ATP-binding protein
MILVEKLSKTYGPVAAVRDLSFEVGKGEVVGFLGPNGAGKTTTLRIIAGFLGATRGRVVVDGFDIVERAIEARAHIGYMPENIPLYPEMRVGEYLRFRAEVKRVPRAARRDAVERSMRQARVEDHADVPIGKLSKGYRQRVGLADALVASPSVLVLDEPTSGLDPNQIREVRELVRSLGREHTVLLSTHILSEVEATCDRVLVIDRGRLVGHGTLEELRRLRRSASARFVVRGDVESALEALRALEACGTVRRVPSAAADRAGEPEHGVQLEVGWKPSMLDTAAAMELAVAALVGAGVHVREAAPRRASLEEVFAALTEDDGTGAGAQSGAGAGDDGGEDGARRKETAS